MERPKFIALQVQPDFPGEDLTEHNAEMLGGYYLRGSTPGLMGEADRFAQHQRPLFEMAQLALWLGEVKINDAPQEYQAFTQGFAAYELAQALVTRRAYDTTLSMLRTDLHFVNSALPTFVEVAARSQTFPKERPNLHRALAASGNRDGGGCADCIGTPRPYDWCAIGV